MDMDSSHQNWLAFSLSNHSLFHPLFNSNPSSSCGVVNQENGGAETDHHLSVLRGGGPKLEDFLGASGGSSGGPAPQYDGGAQGVNISNVEIYGDSELKTIAASFLHGLSNEQSDDNQKQVAVAPLPEPPTKKAVETFGQRTSIFRGVTRHRWTGRYEAHLWDNSCRREGQSRKGRQVYLGGYDKEEKAARAYDLAALKYWGPTTTTNFPVSDYEREMEEMKHMTRQEFVASLRRKSSGFSRGASIYRGVTRHHQHGRWQARIGRVAGNKDLYLGTFSTQEEAAEAYDIAAIKFRGLNAVTNFDMSRYDVRSIASSNLPIGGVNNKSKTSSGSISDNKSTDDSNKELSSNSNSNSNSVSFPPQNSTATINFALPVKQDHSMSLWSALGYQNSTITNPTRNPNASVSLFQDSNFNIEFQANNNEGFFNGCGYFQHQENSTNASSTSTPSSAPSSLAPATNNGAVSGDAVLGNANWMAPSVHSFQAAKSNLSSFQTPIFGME